MRPRVTSVGLIMPPGRNQDFQYPAHIDPQSIAALPPMPGVYFFLDSDDTPLYIGKSVNLRSRVMAHLRCADEAGLLRATSKIAFQRSAGEIGALLQESQLVKEHQPPFNSQLRHFGEWFALLLPDGECRPKVVGSFEAEPDHVEFIYGMFTSRSAAQEGLRALLRAYKLCPARCGLEATVHGRACFSRQIGRCAGACIGAESADQHDGRLRLALQHLQAAVWPYPGAVGIVEECDGWRQTHVVERWCYLGSLEGRKKKLKPRRLQAIDVDTYRILAGPLLSGELRVVPM